MQKLILILEGIRNPCWIKSFLGYSSKISPKLWLYSNYERRWLEPLIKNLRSTFKRGFAWEQANLKANHIETILPYYILEPYGHELVDMAPILDNIVQRSSFTGWIP